MAPNTIKQKTKQNQLKRKDRKSTKENVIISYCKVIRINCIQCHKTSIHKNNDWSISKANNFKAKVINTSIRGMPEERTLEDRRIHCTLNRIG